VAAGPVVGGILTHAWTWRSVFLVNLPVGVLGILLTLRHVPPVPPHHDGELDIKAQVLGIVALGALTFGLIQGGVWGWSSAPVILALLLAIASGVLFYRGERSAEHPMLPPALFRDPTFSAANAVGAILSFGFYGELFLMSLFFQQVQHRSPLAAGLALLPQTAVISLMNFVSGQITARPAGDRHRAFHDRVALGIGARRRAVSRRKRPQSGVRREVVIGSGPRVSRSDCVVLSRRETRGSLPGHRSTSRVSDA